MAQTPVPFSSSFRSLTLNVTTGTSPNQVTRTQAITSVFQGNNSFPITDANILNAFNSQAAGTSFTSSIVAEYGSDGNGNALKTVSTPSVASFIPRPPPPISLAANGVTIRYTPPVGYTPPSFPLFIQANLRGTSTEWFAVINQDSTPNINAYAKSNSSSFFTPPGEIMPVIYNNIVTTLITNMHGLFYEVGAYGAVLGVFTHNVSSWDTSNVTNMFRAFWRSRFNSEINDWDVSNVTDMGLLFNDNEFFNKPLNKWNTSKVTNMQNMFQNTFFNQDISGWNVALTPARPSLTRSNFATNSPLALPANSHNLPLFE